MKIGAPRCYQAVCDRDPRFDGRFFTGVRSTGIYCRPVCPARTPLRRSCQFFSTAAAAEKAGFRACKRCRPDRLAGYSRVDIVRRVARQLRDRILNGALDRAGVEALAREFGYSARQLRRTLRQSEGTSPTQLALRTRARRARQLVLDTQRPFAEIARAAGFGTVRHFNQVFLREHGMSPRALRESTRHD